MKESKHIKAFRERHLKAGESIAAHGEGYIGEMMGHGDNVQRNGMLVVTNQRVAFYRKGFFGEVLQTMPLKSITSVERKSVLGHCTLRMHTSHDDLTFKAFDKVVDTLADAVEAGRDALTASTGGVQ